MNNDTLQPYTTYVRMYNHVQPYTTYVRMYSLQVSLFTAYKSSNDSFNASTFVLFINEGRQTLDFIMYVQYWPVLWQELKSDGWWCGRGLEAHGCNLIRTYVSGDAEYFT